MDGNKFAHILMGYITIIRSIIVLSILIAIASCGGGSNLLNNKPQSETPNKPEENPLNLPTDDHEDDQDHDHDKNEDLPIISTEEEKPLVRPRPKPPKAKPLNQGKNEQDDTDDEDTENEDADNEEVKPVEEEVEDLTEPLLQRDGVYRSDKIANLNYDEVRHMPIYHDNLRILIGIDLEIDPEETTKSWLSTRSERQNAVLHYGSRKDNSSKEKIERYLDYFPDKFRERGRWAIKDKNITVKYTGNASSDDIERLARAIQHINVALPKGSKLRMDKSLSTESAKDLLFDRNESIVVDFKNKKSDGVPDNGGVAKRYYYLDHIRNSKVEISIGRYYDNRYYGDWYGTYILVHELIHALGFSGGHVPQNYDSIMSPIRNLSRHTSVNPPPPVSVLYQLDREAVQVLLNPNKLDNWSEDSKHLVLNGEHAIWGAAYRNGYIEPWAYGNIPSQSLSDAELGTSATWLGTIAGWTPSGDTVSGDASINVTFENMTGSANFTDLESWAAGTALGESETGVQWNDGNLAYDISVRGNSFKQTGGDSGLLTGAFTGSKHQGATGTLQRDDLTAAFGTHRE